MQPVLADERMSDVDALVWAIESEPRFRTTIAALAMFDRGLDRGELRHRIDRASRVVARLRQRVVPDPIPTGAPRWCVDNDFNLARHFRVTQLSNGSDEALAALVRDLIVQPFDRSTPLWEFTLIEGLDNGASALLLKSHHAVSDGVGGVEMMLELFDLQADATPDRTVLPPSPTGGVLPGGGNALLDDLRRILDFAATPRSLADLVGTAQTAGEALGSAARVFRPPTKVGLPTDRSTALDIRFFDVPLADLKGAGARIDGSINDAFVAGIALGVSDYLQAEGDTTLQVSIPINTRGDRHDAGGNHWTPGRINLLLDRRCPPDVVAAGVRSAVNTARDEPAQNLVTSLAGVLRRLPGPARTGLTHSMSSGLDLAASNVPGSPLPLHLCGEEVRSLIPFGPLSGCAANVTLMSHASQAHLGITTDPAAIADADAFAQHIHDGLTAMIKGS